MATSTHVLGNGLRVVIEQDPSVETVAISLALKAGTYFDGAHPGKAHFLEHVVFAGTEAFVTKSELSRFAEERGIRKNGMTNRTYANYVAEGRPQDIGTMCTFLAEITMRPLIREEDVASERSVIGKEINRAHDRVEDHISRMITPMLFPNQPLSHPNLGTVESIAETSAADLRAFWETHYVARNAVLTIRGPISDQETLSHSTACFGMMREGNEAILEEATPASEPRIAVENRQGISQAHFRLSYPAYPKNDPRAASAFLLWTILQSGLSSRLMKRLREKEGLIYSFSETAFAAANYGAWICGTGVEEKSLNAVLSIINEELGLFLRDGVTADELSRAKNIRAVNLAVEAQRNENRAFECCCDVLFYGGVEPVASKIARYEAITAEELMATARELFSRPAQLAVIAPTLTEADIVF